MTAVPQRDSRILLKGCNTQSDRAGSGKGVGKYQEGEGCLASDVDGSLVSPWGVPGVEVERLIGVVHFGESGAAE